MKTKIKLFIRQQWQHVKKFLRWYAFNVFIPAVVVIALIGVSVHQTSKAQAKDEVVPIVEAEDVPPILLKISKCESGGKQFKENGRVIRGKVTPSDIGKFQINEVIWNDKARELGFDIFTEEGNTQFAVWLLNNYGSAPWYLSSNCWNK